MDRLDLRFHLQAALCLAFLARVAEGQTQIVTCSTTAGEFVIEVYPDWAPNGAKRFLELVDAGYFTDAPLFRVVPNYLVQYGIAADPKVTAKWQTPIQDDPTLYIPVQRGTIGFAGHGMHTRMTSLYISYGNTRHLGRRPWEVPIGQVSQGMEVVDKFYSGYGEIEVFGGHAPDQLRLMHEGNMYTKAEFPELSYIKSCTAEEEPSLQEVVATETHQQKESRRQHAGVEAMDEEIRRQLEEEMDIGAMVRSFDAQLPSHKSNSTSFLRLMFVLCLVSGMVMMLVGGIRARSIATLAGPSLDGKMN